MRVILGMLMALLAGAALAEGGGIGIVAVVDDQVISSIDLNDRVALVMGTTNIPDTPENRARIVPQILRQLVDEKLQMEEATRDSISISDAKLREGIAMIEKQNGKEPGSLEQFLTDRGLSKLSMFAQVRAQMAWAEVVRKKVRPKIKISDQEVERYTRRKAAPAAAQAKIEEVLIAAIHIPVDAPQHEANVRKLAEKLASEIRAGASFEGVASQFSSSATGTKTTDPFWVETAQIDPAIAQALSKVAKGGISDPVRTPTGYQIIKLVDVRQSQVKDAAAPAEDERAELAFKQILMTLKPDARPKEAELLLQLAKEVQQSPGKCEDKSMAGAGDLSDMDFRVTLTRALSGDLPDKLRDFLMQLKVGAASDPVITPQGIRLFMLCERIDLPAGKGTGSEHDDEAREAIYREKLELEAQKYLRDLRREAFIEIRGQ
jgi:peptidyl-prolyl cis-trans isomerase SurA